ncbi:hypothetical protein EV421DRAFT_724050 [Armillaria borealis]|uniref:Uncharacterized protein n=1 Tax=Armillaria borealis TaxID=47425 RepID=A0AA39JH86_9AGAR|nr:hypothetical protein EV421DRAFT_724050 [Armillaria borealis]
MAPFNSLPAELVHAIIYEFRHDRESLKSFASAHRSFVPFAQNHIFSTVRLSFGHLICSDRSRCTQLLDILSSSPRIASFVRNLHICIVPTPFWLPNTLPNELSRENSPLIHILRVLSSLRHIRVFQGAGNGWSVRWGDISPDLQAAMRTSFTSSSIRSITLERLAFRGFEEFSFLFIHAQTVEELSLTGIRFVPSSDSSSLRYHDLKLRLPNLRNLSMRFYRRDLAFTKDRGWESPDILGFVLFLPSLVYLDSLRRLSIFVDHLEDCASIREYLGAFGNSIAAVTMNNSCVNSITIAVEKFRY